ncbi:MAG TPA: FAD-dependent oxidoreductase [Marmoricola sp.]|nr:FAD-dependent oxidoreductase [Marmoricola sp.]
MSENSAHPIVIVGGGLAAGTTVTSLRDRGYSGPVILFADEPHLPYERPPLSKGYLLGKEAADSALVHDAAWYAEHSVDVRTGMRVDAVDTDRHLIRAGGEDIAYRGLLLATGARPRHLAIADNSGAEIHYLRTLDDSTALKARFGDGARVGIIGAGWIGLEVAAAARLAGCSVTVWEAASAPLQRVLGDEVGELFAQLHRERGVDLRLSAQLQSISEQGGVATVEADGVRVEVDLLVVGVGVEPAVELAAAAGLAVDNGVLVDAHLRTSAPDVFAAGDVANLDHPVLGRRIRVEHWDTAIKHGKVAAAGLLGQDATADDLPYFFTDQYDLGIEYVGNPGPVGFDQVVISGDREGPVESRVFRVWWLRDGLVVAGMHVNDWDAIGRVRQLVGTRASSADLNS